MPGMPHGPRLPDSCLSAQLGLQSRVSCCTRVLHDLKPQPRAPVTREHGRPWLWVQGSPEAPPAPSLGTDAPDPFVGAPRLECQPRPPQPAPWQQARCAQLTAGREPVTLPPAPAQLPGEPGEGSALLAPQPCCALWPGASISSPTQGTPVAVPRGRCDHGQVRWALGAAGPGSTARLFVRSSEEPMWVITGGFSSERWASAPMHGDSCPRDLGAGSRAGTGTQACRPLPPRPCGCSLGPPLCAEGRVRLRWDGASGHLAFLGGSYTSGRAV